MKLVKHKARIHANLAMIGFFSVVMIGTAWSGKKAFQRGHTVTDMNLEWHKNFNASGVVGSIHSEGRGGEAAAAATASSVVSHAR